MERSDLPTADTSRTPPAPGTFRAALPLQRDTGALPLPAQCLPPTLTNAPAVHAPPAPGAASGPSGAALPGGPARERQGQPPPSGAPPRPPAGAARTGPPPAALPARRHRRGRRASGPTSASQALTQHSCHQPQSRT